jgi:hypothetical protein
MKHTRGLWMAVILGMTALACVVPGLPTASAPPPTPDTRLERMVAETVSAALMLTQQAVPTATEVPSATPEPTVTATLAATPTQSAESVLDKNADGTSTFIDLSGKYQLTIPMQWLVVRINAPEYDSALQLPEASNPSIQRSLTTIKEQDPNVFRLFMLDIAEEHIEGGFVTNINLVWDQQMEVSLADENDLKTIAASLPASLQNAEVTGTELAATQNEIPYGVITARTPAFTQDGTSIVVIQKLVFLDLPVGTLNITLSTTETWQETVEPSFDTLIESFIVLD